MQPEHLIGQTLGHYHIQRQIGYGGMATVFLAEDIHLGREVAVKVFWPRPGETQDFLRRFSREARVLAQLDHPNILPVYDYGEQGEMAYLITPHMAGGTLRETLKKRKALPPSEAIELVIQVLPALQYAHSRNLIHRDIKPGNLLFKGDGNLVLADFGLVKVIGNDGSGRIPLETLAQSTQSIAGTPEYMAPEQIEGKVSPASDIYALGVVLYEMVTGTRPFTGTTLLSILMKHVHEQPRPPREINPYISPSLEAIILRALEKDPLKRFATPDDFQQALLLISNPQSGRAINPSSNPGLSGEISTIAQDGPTIAASRTQFPDPLSPMVALDVQTQGSVLQNTPPANQQIRANSLHSEQIITTGRPGINEPMRPVQQSWTPLQPIPQALPQPERRKKGCTPVMVLLLLLLLLAGMVSALFLTPIGKGLLNRNITATTGPGTQTANTQTLNTPTGNGTTPGTGATPPIVNNNNMPKTVTTCPGSGTARSAVIAPLSLGNHPTIVYIVNEGPANAPTAGTVKIYDTVTTKKTEISKINAAIIDAAQVSRNRQWVLFTVSVAGRSQLRLVRLDGKGLQTLYCATNGTHITAAQWSVDQKFVIFDELPESGPPTIYLLNLQDGSIQVEVNSSLPGGISLLPRTWLDNTHVVMTGFVPQSDAPLANVYLLDISKGANQSTGDIQQIFDSTNSGQCWDFDSNNGGDALYIAQCTPNQPHGSGKITRQAVNGHSLTAILDSSTLAINSVRVVDPNDTHLLATASDISLGASNGDPENDGLYLVKTSDGSFQRLLGAKSGEVCTLNAFSQYFWSNISRDSSMYVVQTTNVSAHRYSLAYGKISGGPLTTFADITDTALAIAGWTTT